MKNKAVGAIPLNKEKKVLLQLRDNKQDIVYPGHWGLLGGRIEKDENPFDALKREIKEEIGFDLQGAEFLGIFDDLKDNLCYVYIFPCNEKTTAITLLEGQKLGYFNFDEIMQLQLPEPLRQLFKDKKGEIFNSV